MPTISEKEAQEYAAYKARKAKSQARKAAVREFVSAHKAEIDALVKAR